MQNRFGLKDFVLMVLVIASIAMVGLMMVQYDRQWDEVQAVEAKVDNLEAQLSRIERTSGETSRTLGAVAQTLLEGVIARPAQGTGSGAGQGGETANNTPVRRDAGDWHRDGVEVVTAEPFTYYSDPRDDDGFAEGGTFTEIFEGQPPIITPYLYADVYGRRVVDMVCESLGWYNARSLKMEGRLAESWQYDPNGMWLRVKIREEAVFSNGDPVTAEDVRWTYQDFLYNPQIEAERFRSVYQAIGDIEVISDKVVEFTFKEPRFDNFDQAFGFKILPKGVYERWASSPTTFNSSTGLLIGSGPFKLEALNPNDQWTPPTPIRLVRNELYWGPRPPLDGLTYVTIAEGLTRLTEFVNGTGDMMRPNSEQFITKRADASFTEDVDPKMWFNMRGGYSFIAWQCGLRNGERATPFSDARVRKAMTLLTNRERLLRDVSKGLARVATSPFLSSTPQSDPSIEPWPHDPEAAAAMLREAGWWDRDGDNILENERGDEFRFQMTFGSGSESTLAMMNFLKGEYAEAGIVMELNPIEWSILSEVLNRRDFDAISFAWSASAPENDPNQIWHSSSIRNQGDNFIQWASDEADALISKGRQTLDDEERMKVWHELHAVFHEEQPYTFMLELPWLRFVRERVQNVEEYNSGLEQFEFWISNERGATPSF